MNYHRITRQKRLIGWLEHFVPAKVFSMPTQARMSHNRRLMGQPARVHPVIARSQGSFFHAARFGQGAGCGWRARAGQTGRIAKFVGLAGTQEGFMADISDSKLKVHDHWKDLSQQFDYFLLATIGALLAYTVQHIQPERITASPYAVTLLAVLTLLCAFYFGIRCVEKKMEVLSYTAKKLEATEHLYSLLDNPQVPLLVHKDGESQIMDPAAALRATQELQIEIQVLREFEEKAATSSGVAFRWRNRMLIGGFVLLAASRVLEPYFHKP
jgi:hypothetical protein